MTQEGPESLPYRSSHAVLPPRISGETMAGYMTRVNKDRDDRGLAGRIVGWWWDKPNDEWAFWWMGPMP